MNYQLLMPIIVFLALLAGDALGQYRRARWLRKNQARLRQEARHIIRDAERTGQSTMAEAELKARSVLLDERRQFEKEMEDLRQGLLEREKIIDRRFESLCQRETELERRASETDRLRQDVNAKDQAATDKALAMEAELVNLSGLSQEAARELVLERARLQARELAAREAGAAYEREMAQSKARVQEILVSAIENQAGPVASTRSVSRVSLESDDMRSRIIGRDGRNIRAFEAICGVDLLLDEMPGQAVISSQNPERREVARKTLEALILDGRIQPSRIEEFAKTAQADVQNGLAEHGRDAAERAGAGALSDDIAVALGRLKYRSSYAQNVLEHLVEVANLSGALAIELGLDEERQVQARRAALLHDIGKGLPLSSRAPHALAGAEFLEHCGEVPEIVNAVAAHHHDVPDKSLLCALVRAADSLSAARPGARREDLSAYVQRLEQMEAVARGFEAVQKAYALQAGRELHVIVASEIIPDIGMPLLASQIAAEIEKHVNSGTEVKVTLIRESRAESRATWRVPQAEQDKAEI